MHVHLPWGSLLRAVVEPETLRRIARLSRSGAAVCVRVNASILDDPAVVMRLSLPAAGKQSLEARLTAAYAAAGIQVAITQADLDWPLRGPDGSALAGRCESLPSTVRSSIRGGTNGPTEALRR